MKQRSDDRPKGSEPEFNPILIQSYFDGELKSDELEALSLEAITSHPMLEVLAELREVVRYDSQQALDDIDDMALFNAIHRQIASEKQVTEVPKACASKSPLSSRFGVRLKQSARWIPAFVGAALLLLSIPGLVMLFGNDKLSPNDGSSDIVSIDIHGQGVRHETQNDRSQVPETLQVAAPLLQIKIHDDQQLTVHEMDFAIRHLIDRIEILEDAKRNAYDNGDFGLARPTIEPLNNGHKL